MHHNNKLVSRGFHRITKPLLYQLSYVGTSGANIASTGAGYIRSTVATSLRGPMERLLAT
jgi:hypothetical protein